MARETITVEITGIDTSDASNVMVCVKEPDGNESMIGTFVPECVLKTGDAAIAILDSETEQTPLPGGGFLPPAPRWVWGNACNSCKHNPYVHKDPKDCEAARHS
jgi:hypothetical protein